MKKILSRVLVPAILGGGLILACNSDFPSGGDDDFTLAGPQGGDIFVTGDSTAIEWDSNVGGTVKIELLESGLPCEVLAESEPDDGSFDWVVGGCGESSAYQIQITSNDDSTRAATGRNFSIWAAGVCDSGKWRVVTTQKPCVGPVKTVSDTCVVMEDPVQGLEDLIAGDLFPDDCQAIAEEGEVSLDCAVDVLLDELFPELGESEGVDLSECIGTFAMSGGGTYEDDRFDYDYEVWMDCGGACKPEAIFKVCAPLQLVLGSKACPTKMTISGRLE